MTDASQGLMPSVTREAAQKLQQYVLLGVRAASSLTCIGWKRPALTRTLSIAAPANDLAAGCWACCSWAASLAAVAPRLPAFAVKGLSVSSAAHSCGDDTLLQSCAGALGALPL